MTNLIKNAVIRRDVTRGRLTTGYIDLVAKLHSDGASIPVLAGSILFAGMDFNPSPLSLPVLQYV